MPHYVALLRGIAPMNPNMHNEKLRGVFESLGFTQVSSVISSGNIVFASPSKDAAALEAKIEAAWPKKLGFSSTTIVRTLQELKTLEAENPFKGYTHSRKTSLNVTFLKHKRGAKSPLPEGAHYKVLAAYPREICSVIDTLAGKTPDFMAKAEKLYGKEITTRSWNTVQKIMGKLETQEAGRNS